MFCIFITVFVIASGLTASDEICSRPLDEVCKPDTQPFFPKNTEELERICRIIIKALDCGIEHEEACPSEIGFLPDAYQYLAMFHEVCNPDTLLNAVVTANIECFYEKVKNEARECYMNAPSNETLEKGAKVLSKDFEALTDNDEDEANLFICLSELNSVACQAILTGEKCGAVAKDAFVDIIRRIPFFHRCPEEAIKKLPTIIQLRELENAVEEALERRKK